MPAIFSVSQLTSYLRALLDGDEVLQRVLVQGEISNCRLHSSGHLYFTLKDQASSLRAVMFRSRAQSLLFQPTDGLQVVAQGSISVYERDGQYQIVVNSLQPAGLGSLYLAFEQLKQKLQAEGLFAASRKRPLPAFPQVIAIATSPTGAAVRDLLAIIRRRYPKVRIYLFPIAVQGREAPQSIVRALDLLGRLPEVDLVILGRGGGSQEELAAFNQEAVARAIAACAKPVISAVGHENDYTIADFVADVRAATPSAAAELAVPVLWEVERNLANQLERLVLAQRSLIGRRQRELRQLSTRHVFRSAPNLLRPLQQNLDSWELRLRQAMLARQQAQAAALQLAAGRLQAMSPLAVLNRGYSITQKNGQVIAAATQVALGETLETILADGRIESRVLATRGSRDAESNGDKATEF